jgi:hypothetical protein
MHKTLLLVLLAASCFGQNAAVSINRGTGTPPGPYYPRVVAQVSLPNQSASVGPATLYTPPEDGLFRVSVYMVETQPYPSSGCASNDTCAYITVEYQWTDDGGIQSIYGNAPSQAPAPEYGLTDSANSVAFLNGIRPEMITPSGPGETFVVRALSGTPISYYIDYSLYPGSSSAATYSCFITVERLM